MRSKFAYFSFVGMLAVAAMIRLLPHMPNFTPVEGITLFGAAYLSRKHLAYILPIITLYLTDLIINNTVARSFFADQEGFIWFSDYMIFNVLALIIIAFVSRPILTKVNYYTVPLAAVSSSVLFFAVSNFGVWITSHGAYTKDLQGLMACFTAALPFFRTSLASTFLFTAVIFAAFEFFQKTSVVTRSSV